MEKDFALGIWCATTINFNTILLGGGTSKGSLGITS